MDINFYMHTRECHRTLLAHGGFAIVELCNCGAVHLSLGAVTLRLAPEAVGELTTVMADAARALALHEAYAACRPAIDEAVS